MTVTSDTSKRKYGKMIPHMRMTLETMLNIDPNDTMVPTGIIKAMNETSHDKLISSRERVARPELILKQYAQSF